MLPSRLCRMQLMLSPHKSAVLQQALSIHPQQSIPGAGSCGGQGQPPSEAGWAQHPSRPPQPEEHWSGPRSSRCPEGAGGPAQGRPSHLWWHAELRLCVWLYWAHRFPTKVADRLHSACQTWQLLMPACPRCQARQSQQGQEQAHLTGGRGSYDGTAHCRRRPGRPTPALPACHTQHALLQHLHTRHTCCSTASDGLLACSACLQQMPGGMSCGTTARTHSDSPCSML